MSLPVAFPPAAPAVDGENPAYLREQIITYLGNKRALLPFIGTALQQVKSALGKERLRLLDLFAGSGIVSRFFKAHAEVLHSNDLEDYARILAQCYLANASELDHAHLAHTLATLRAEITAHPTAGFITELYAPRDETRISAEDRVFYTRANATFLDTARPAIGRLPAAEQPFFLAPLLALASVHANTSGVFKGFYKSAQGIGQFGGEGRDALGRILRPMELQLPVFSRFSCAHHLHQADANQLVHQLPELDLAYLDPPYNQHPYGSNYFMLNLLVRYQRPAELSRVSGIPTGWNRSAYNQRAAAADTLFRLIEDCPARFILLSYNSEGFIPHEHFRTELQRHGRVEVLQTSYSAFKGSRNLRQRPARVTEYLYLLQKR